jgi:hypothetical protein
MREARFFSVFSKMPAGTMRSAALFAAGHDGTVEAFAEVGGEFVNFVRAVNFYSFTGGVEDDFAVAALIHVLLDFGAQRRGNGVVNEVVEKRNKLGAGHFSAPSSLDGALAVLLRK